MHFGQLRAYRAKETPKSQKSRNVVYAFASTYGIQRGLSPSS